MGIIEPGKDGIILGDPVPWFGAPLIADGSFNLQVAAGRWIVLAFLGAPANPRAEQELAELLREADLFDWDRVVFYGVLTASPADPEPYTRLCTAAVSFIATTMAPCAAYCAACPRSKTPPACRFAFRC